ncbi:MAG: D-glycerate dehydrogenase [Chloroflexi bacterium]|nr:D-glycerate dehydrogenase [Chloroflexota bacterium]
MLLPKPKVYVAARLPEHFLAPLLERCQVTAYEGRGQVPRQELASQAREVEGLLAPSSLAIDTGVLEAAQRLRILSNIGVGYDNVDLEQATRKGVLVTNTPGILSDAVAELTMGLLLQLSRRLPEAEQVVREGRWDASGAVAPFGTDLRGKTLAVIGLGRIGREVARRALAFDMRVIYHDARADVPSPPGVGRAADLEDALRQADFLTLHTNLTPGSAHLIGARELALMKPAAYLINTSRGAIVDQAALFEALKTGRIAGAALDVLEQEPPAPDEPLLSLANVIITPHIGTATRETRSAMIELAVRNLLACLAGEPCENIVNRPD